MSWPITFEVLGTPMPQGSKKAFNANGRAMMKEAGGLRHAQWRNAVADKARTVATRDDIDTPLTGPLRVDVTYGFPMPKSRPKRIRNLGAVYKTSAPDLDKLDRCLRDGLMAGGLIADDALICTGTSTKYERTDFTGAVVTISQLDNGATQ